MESFVEQGFFMMNFIHFVSAMSMWQNIMPCHFRLYLMWKRIFQEYVVHVIKKNFKKFYHLHMLTLMFTRSQNNIIVSKDSWWTTQANWNVVWIIYDFGDVIVRMVDKEHTSLFHWTQWLDRHTKQLIKH